ncbi:hypothetical protein BU25DRAFT_421509 [Macroventuria anomochaeta]|uniref:Uncharacterized protein n=1 Tax=Macroventuria anomochaeta TaxID=301207 RepID=A0ACB6S0E9_9PLEO|nr:uncharacterized protein BU25DRAFT_421509 [Macroventuria anomochaeta]KAF2627498.1 hypothetical protein BU25DRAFT_421509 [Macroventuria anomochaeta]
MAPTLLEAAALALRASSIVCPTTPTCPQDDKCTYVSKGVTLHVNCATNFYGGDLQLAQGANSRTFALSCGIDFYGGDFTNMKAASLVVCTQACAETRNVLLLAFFGGKGLGHCYLKNKNNAASANESIDGDYCCRHPGCSSSFYHLVVLFADRSYVANHCFDIKQYGLLDFVRCQLFIVEHGSFVLIKFIRHRDIKRDQEVFQHF